MNPSRSFYTAYRIERTLRKTNFFNLTRQPFLVGKALHRPQIGSRLAIKSIALHKGNITAPKYILERDIPGIGSAEPEQLREAAKKSNEVLRQMGPSIQWIETYIAEKTFCVYLADNEELIHKHAEISGFPATKVTEIRKMIDPTTEQAV